MSKCYECKYEHSDCKGNKRNDCPSFKKKNAVNYAARIRELESDPKFIYQVHRRGGEWEDAYDYIEGTYLKEENAKVRVEEFIVRQLARIKEADFCEGCNYDKECFEPCGLAKCKNEMYISDDYRTEEYYIVKVLIDDWSKEE